MKILGFSDVSLLDVMMIKYYRLKWESDVEMLNQHSYDFKSLRFTLKINIKLINCWFNYEMNFRFIIETNKDFYSNISNSLIMFHQN